MSDEIRFAWKLRDERRSHNKTRWWLAGVAFFLWLHVIVDVFLLLRMIRWGGA